MSEVKHTPGIWFVNHESKDVGDGKLSIEVDGDYFIAQVDEGICQEANARLIAAGPDLFDSHEPDREGPDFLDWVASRLVLHGDHPQADFIVCLRRRAEKARAAIAKATGQA